MTRSVLRNRRLLASTIALGLALGLALGALSQVPAAGAQDAPLIAFVVDKAGPVAWVPEAFARDGAQVAWCESEYKADAVSGTNDFGFWQLNRRWQESRVNRMGYQWADLANPYINTEVADRHLA